MPEHTAAVETPSTVARVAVPPRTGLWTTYATLLRWTFGQTGPMLPFVIAVEALLAAGIIIGFGFLVPGIDTASAQFLSTGAPTVLLMVVGLVIVPMGVAQARASGTFTYLRAQPVPRQLLLLADLTVWLGVALPSIAVAMIVAWLRYDFGYVFDWPLLVATAALTSVTAASVGYAIAVVLPPLLTQITTQVLVFFVMLFSPVTFPASRLPEWFQTVHDWLPFRPAADLLRAGLISDSYTASWRDLAVLLVWCVLGFAISLRAVVRRA
ncbi:multidrug ABC transporter permease [Prauserella marina]|uniref:ABC-2 type transport system permease protein n=1 Tax=Prauserella marina TaxID=530584 RepID=A0A222VKY6_9PSEU|nr:ABC transporter permease [Prauserella marina]ASR34492.1 multidrug ABC transporter permease [Prauserella marina]PWV85910.1 ABC-2 type transport system permease protein [Prauserella marina]SDC42530.1 ABC-2 type transport system permease protein [Prauserella marina]